MRLIRTARSAALDEGRARLIGGRANTGNWLALLAVTAPNNGGTALLGVWLRA